MWPLLVRWILSPRAGAWVPVWLAFGFFASKRPLASFCIMCAQRHRFGPSGAASTANVAANKSFGSSRRHRLPILQISGDWGNHCELEGRSQHETRVSV